MTENEITVLEMIRNHSDPDKAILIAIEIFTRLIEQPEATE